ncbi:hypothetical protein R5R35_010966 [Gryllus longicercus]|uniref:Uncharacterized protein n=1 Tax=Gryllus longicercus TaxID=2509291 RepID=A0AAN9VV33_9ORTH
MIVGTTSKSYMKSNQDLLLYLSFSWTMYMAMVIILDMGLYEWLWEKVMSRFGSGDTAVTEMMTWMVKYKGWEKISRKVHHLLLLIYLSTT